MPKLVVAGFGGIGGGAKDKDEGCAEPSSDPLESG